MSKEKKSAKSEVTSEAGKKAKPAKKKGSMATLVLTFLIGIGGLIFLPTSIVFVVGMIPSIVAFYTDNSAKKATATTIGLLNFSGVFTQILELWSTGHSNTNALAIVMDMNALLIMYAGAGFGHALLTVVPSVVATFVITESKQKLNDVRKQQKLLVDTWGTQVTGEARKGIINLKTDIDYGMDAEKGEDTR